jgi:hypothetical protein
MKTRGAVLLTIALSILASLLQLHIAGKDVPLLVFVIWGTAIWAAIDSSKIQLKCYKSGIACGPVVLFLGVLLLWVIAFPWYLAVRYKIKTGVAALKDELANTTA